jgi:hypothetical protein
MMHDPGEMAPTLHLNTITEMTVKNLGGEGMEE